MNGANNDGGTTYKFIKYNMDKKEPYYTWHGQPLTKYEYVMLWYEIVADILAEDGLAYSDYKEANSVIDKIKNKPTSL